MRVLLVASEVHPFAKTGGLADVVGALPRALRALGIEPAICLPLYRKVRERGDRLEVVARSVPCSFAGGNRPFRLLRTALPGAPEVPVFLVENPGMFEAEDAFYGTEPGSYGDAHLRFLYFSRAILRVPRAAGFWPDVFHLNDWQTALVAPLLRTVHREDLELSRSATVLTIHNLAYQGVFPVEDLRHAGVNDFLLSEGRLIEAGSGNLLAGGIRFADAVSTVSRSYAREILTPGFGCGLEGLLSWRRGLLTGIVNGLDTEAWNPATDPQLPAHYGPDDLAGKRRCREALIEAAGLEATDGPVLGIVSRLAAQKGLGLVTSVADGLFRQDPSLRLVVLGSGEPDIENAFRALQSRHPGRIHARLAFDPAFSSLVEAGADIFLMPSRFEPCGLNQLISMRYGTPPVVHRVGGLRDTVVDATPESLERGEATGFCFDGFEPQAFLRAVLRAVDLHRSHPERFRSVQLAGMRTDWSWERSAREYQALYTQAIRRRRDGTHLEAVLSGIPREPLEIELPPVAEIPSDYGNDRLVVLARDPSTIFVQWDLSGPAGRSHFASGGDSALELVVRDEGTGREDIQRLSRGQGECFLNAASAARLSVWIRASGPGGARVLAASDPLTMPPDLWPPE